MEGIREERCNVSSEARRKNQYGEGPRSDSQSSVKMRNDEICNRDTTKKDKAYGKKRVVDECPDFPILTMRGVGVDVLGKDDGENGKRNGEEAAELLYRENCAEFSGANVSGDEP